MCVSTFGVSWTVRYFFGGDGWLGSDASATSFAALHIFQFGMGLRYKFSFTFLPKGKCIKRDRVMIRTQYDVYV